jgi:carbamoyltransferase
MALAAYGAPRVLPALRELVRATDDGGFVAPAVDWTRFTTARHPEERWRPEHADLAASVQRRLEEVILDLARWLVRARVPHERPADLAHAVADVLAADGIVAWFQGRSEWGPRALGHRSLLADRRRVRNLERLNDVKGREQFRPVAPMVLAERAAEVFDGPWPSPHMLFTHRVRPAWCARIPAVVHVDGTARVQTAGDPRDVLEGFGAAPIDALALGPFLVRRPRGAA